MNQDVEIHLGREPDILWTLTAGIKLIRDLQSTAFTEDFYLALAGGCLNRGYSYNDLDIVAVNNHPASSYPSLKAALDKILQQVSTVKLVNHRVHLKWERLYVECLVIERLPRDLL